MFIKVGTSYINLNKVAKIDILEGNTVVFWYDDSSSITYKLNDEEINHLKQILYLV